jgi:hypothetical protein
MSLEDKLASLVDAITANTDALQHLASAYRAPPAPIVPVAPPADKRPPGRPPKATTAPPPAPLGAAAAAAVAATAPPVPAPPPAAVKAKAEPDLATPPEATYEDLSAAVNAVAEKRGRSAAVALFAKLGFASGRELKEKAPEKIGEATRLFREALE